MASTRRKGLSAALGASALAAAALTTAPAVAAVDVRAAQSEAACVSQAMQMARPLIAARVKQGSARALGVDATIKRIREKSQACEDVLFRDGTAENPNAGILVGNGFSFDESTCPVDETCHGGNAGALRGSGGKGHHGGNGGSAGWFGGVAGNGGNAGASCVGDACNGGNGGRAGRFGDGGHGQGRVVDQAFRQVQAAGFGHG